LVLSAHLDDAVFSCWQAIESVASESVTVVTVFAGRPRPGLDPPPWDRACGATDALRQVLTRREEDVAAVGCGGARAIHLEFLDEQYREGPAPRSAIIEAIEELCEDCEEVWIPAAIGGNRDHVIACEAALAATSGVRRVLYADLPYTVAHGWRALVSAAMTNNHDIRSLEAQLAASSFIPARSVPRLHRLTTAERERKLAALRLYRSQLGPLTATFGSWFDDPEVAGFELSWELGESPQRHPPWQLLGRELAARPTPKHPPDARAGRPPFLSVLIRTQGERPESLSEVVKSLLVQTCQDFEVLLLCHQVSPSGLAGVRAQVGRLPEWFRRRVRLVPVDGGTRAHPLNVGVQAARGAYLAVLDDDDLALSSWVEKFRQVAARHPGQLVRARAASLGRQGDQWSVEYLFAEGFDLVDHLVINESPVCAVAYPRECFNELGLRFDDTLPVVEDWDLLLRGAPLCGVATTSTITSLYRHWGNGDDSHSRVSVPEWTAAERAVIEKADRSPLVLPPGSASVVRRDRQELARLRAVESTTSEQLRCLQAEHQAVVEDLRLRLDGTGRHLERVVDEFRRSTSWRLTAPIRALGEIRRRLSSGGNGPGQKPDDATAEPSGPARNQPGSYSASYFEALYQADGDPWGFASQWYERRKYAITLGSLPRQRYRRVFEPGCSIGVLSEQLAARCDALVVSDFAENALQQARARLRTLAHVEVRHMTVPAEWPAGTFDLIVLSEFLYFLDGPDLSEVIERTLSSLDDEGHVIVVHYLPAGKIVQSADEVHDALRAHPGLVGMVTHRESDFILDVLARKPG
jgi:LmbE family N-acetylglucosaminyl deacetylase/protein-L-isoaspartate O-methyltransferase